MNIVGFLPQSFSDWPGKTAAVLFTQGCNFKCGFCHNAQLVEIKKTENDEALILSKIKDLAWSLDGIVITGGEPTLQNDLEDFCKKLKKTGLKVKLDTNGSNPQVLKELIRKKLIDYVAMDLKTNFEKYGTLAKYGETGRIKDSIDTIIKSGIEHEFRTTYIPDVISKEDLKEAVKEIKGAKRYVLQKFIPHNCLEKAYDLFRSPSFEEMADIAENLDFDGEIRIRSEHRELVFRKAKQ
jgi:pyruvate formate lyase activating enzyme